MNNIRTGFSIYTDTICQGAVPVVSDENEKYVIYETELEAQKEIADHAITRLQEFLDGERDFDDAITVEEYVVPVKVDLNGEITDDTGKQFGPYVE
jgi:hypothetical protein